MTNRFSRRLFLSACALGAAGAVLGAPPRAPRKNVALVLDASAAEADAFARRREAVVKAIEQLDDADFVSVVVFADRPTVLVSARPAGDKAAIVAQVRTLEAKGEQALFAGLSKGADEVRRNAQPGFENRIVLFSDGGTGTVGPSGGDVVARLVDSFQKERIQVRTPDNRPLGALAAGPGGRRGGWGQPGRGPGGMGPFNRGPAGRRERMGFGGGRPPRENQP